MTRGTWLRLGGFLLPGLVWLYVFGGGSTIFAIVAGISAFVAGLLGLMLGLTAGWRLVRRRGWKPLERKAAVNFAGMGLFALMAVASLVFGVISLGGWVQDSAERELYEKAPDCSTTVSAPCLSHVAGTVVQKWAETAKGPDWVQVRVEDRTQNIEVETAYNVWDTLVAGQTVKLTSWKGQVTEVTAPGVGTMQTSDSPKFQGFVYVAFAGVSAFAFILFLAGTVTYGLKCLLAMRGVDPETIAA